MSARGRWASITDSAAATWRSRGYRLLPGLQQLRGYKQAWLRWDILAGLTVAAYLVPQVMAYGVLAGLPPVAGLWAAIPSLALYAFIGSSRQLSVGPESTCAIMTAVVVAPLAAGNPGRYAELAAALSVLVGLLAVVGWLLRLGFVGDLLSAPILVGYLAGIAVIMIIGQLGKVTGVHVTGDSLPGELKSFLTQLDTIRWDTVLLSVLTLAFLFVVAWRWPRLPGPLLAVLAVTGITALLHLQEHGVAVVGKLSAGFPPLGLPPLGDYSTLLLPALGVLLVGYTDNVLTGRAFAIRGGYEVDANQEFLALGAANVGAGIFRGMPVSSSGSRTAIGESAGSRTQLHSLVVVACIIVVLLFLRPVLAVFPTAALGAIVIYAATRLVDLAEFRRLARYRRGELVLSLVTLLSVLVFDILKGIVVAVIISGAETLRRIARPHDAIQGHVEGVAGMHDIDDYPDATMTPGLLVYRYDAPLYFANARDFRKRALAAADAHAAGLHWFVLNVEANVDIDITAMDAVEEVRAKLAGRGVVFAFARVKHDILGPLQTYGLADRVGADRLFPTLPTAEAAYRAWESEQASGRHRTPPADAQPDARADTPADD